MIDLIGLGLPVVVTVALTVVAYRLLGKAFATQPNNRLYLQLAYVGLMITALIVLILVLPFSTETRGQLLSLFGLVITAVIALSSTTFVSNAMAGLMLKAMGSFHTGDFIRVTDHFGRVTAKALLHTEIQSEDRDVIVLPNLFVITNPVQVVDQSGTLISAEASIGFDVHRRRVRELLLQAGETAGLQDTFVQILRIGDFAVDYRVTGFLTDVSKIVSKRSELKACVLDSLHRGGVEVMTPNVMNQRPIDPNTAVIPARQSDEDIVSDSGKAERMMFDKAELAARIERFREQCETLRSEVKELREQDKDEPLEIAWREHQIASLQDIIDRFDQDDG